MSPIFSTKHIMDKGAVRIVGNNHLKLDMHAIDNPDESFSSIAFGQGTHFDALLRRNSFSACYTIEENTYNGQTSLQLNVKDLKIE